jgi:hypothetical protein
MAFNPEPVHALAAMGGIDSDDSTWQRVVEAELARESIPMFAQLDTD